MDDPCLKIAEEQPKIIMGEKLPQDDVDVKGAARASKTDRRPNVSEGELPLKKRKTRRGKSKRKQPYSKNSRKTNKLVKPEAPHNSNQFLLEDHGSIEDLDRNLKIDQGSPSTLTRTRDSSFSVDSEGEFYSSPDDEEQFLIKDFDDQYQSLQAERLQNMTKTELVHEYLQLESRLEQLSKKQGAEDEESEDSRPDLKQEVERLSTENERLRRENEMLRGRINKSSDSEDSETDSSDSCSSSSSESNCDCNSCSSRSRSPITNNTDYSKTNGHLPGVETV